VPLRYRYLRGSKGKDSDNTNSTDQYEENEPSEDLQFSESSQHLLYVLPPSELAESAAIDRMDVALDDLEPENFVTEKEADENAVLVRDLRNDTGSVDGNSKNSVPEVQDTVPTTTVAPIIVLAERNDNPRFLPGTLRTVADGFRRAQETKKGTPSTPAPETLVITGVPISEDTPYETPEEVESTTIIPHVEEDERRDPKVLGHSTILEIRSSKPKICFSDGRCIIAHNL